MVARSPPRRTSSVKTTLVVEKRAPTKKHKRIILESPDSSDHDRDADRADGLDFVDEDGE